MVVSLFSRVYRRLGLAISLTLVLAIVAGCGGTPASTPAPAPSSAPSAPAPSKPAAPAQPKVLRVGLTAKLDTLDPRFAIQSTERPAMYLVFNTLTAIDENFKVQPELAESWENPDNTTFIFHLKKGVKFSDGTDFNAAAVKWNMDFILDKNNKSPQASNLASVKSVDVVDDYTVKFNLSTPDPGLLSVLSERPGMIVSPTAAQKAGDKFGQNPVGTGPYLFKSWPTPDSLTFVKNPNSWEADKVKLDSITFTVIPDINVITTKLKAGELDFCDQFTAQNAAMIDGSQGIKLSELKGLNWYEIGFNVTKKPFDNEKLRQAVAYAIDREELKKVLYNNMGRPGTGPINGGWAMDPNFKGIQYDPAKAKQLLTEAGYPSGVSFDLAITSRPDSISQGELLQAQLAKVGIKVNLVQYDAAKQYSMQVSGDLGAYTTSWTPRADPGVIMKMHYHSTGYANNQRWKNADVDKLIDEANSTYDPAKRIAPLQQAEKIAVNSAAIIYLLHPSVFAAMSSKVQNWKWIPDQMARLRYLDLQ